MSDEIENDKKLIIRELLKTNYVGMPRLVDWLDGETDFFTAPASTKHHYAFPGGLAKHSLCVYETMMKLREAFAPETSASSVAIVALLHDVCKTNYYKQRHWEDPISNGIMREYYVDDKVPLGHGEKSLALIARFVNLSVEEACAIRFHMGCWTAGVITDNVLGKTFNQAAEYPLVSLLISADFLSSRVIEKNYDE